MQCIADEADVRKVGVGLMPPQPVPATALTPTARTAERTESPSSAAWLPKPMLPKRMQSGAGQARTK